MPRLIATVGLPGSGKSTWAAAERKRLEANNVECCVVTKDDLRKILVTRGWTWSRENERTVVELRDKLIIAGLEGGKTVISADTNFGKHVSQLAALAKKCGAEFDVKDFTSVKLETCIKRDAGREDSVGEKVIKEMYDKYVAGSHFDVYTPDKSKPEAIICDLDGTVALSKGIRGPFDYGMVSYDRVNDNVADVVRAAALTGKQVVYVSGREDWCYGASIDWLKDHNLPDGPLFMRKTGDHRKDFIIKTEIFDEHIRHHYNVVYCLDDRDQVVARWRGMGLTCLQVDYGAF